MENRPLDPLPIQELCCISRAALLNLCIADSDLRSLGVWDQRQGPSPAVRSRAALHNACLRDSSWARRVTDLLDLQFMNTVVRVRDMSEEAVEQMVELWVASPEGNALPGLLWALCTDDRDDVQGLGVRLCHEAVAVACRELVGGPRPTPVTQEK